MSINTVNRYFSPFLKLLNIYKLNKNIRGYNARMEIEKFKQATHEGCLPSCLLILEHGKVDREKEIELISDSLLKRRDNYYAYNTLSAFTDRYKRDAILFVDMKPFAEYLSLNRDTERVKIESQRINKKFLLALATPYIVYLDDFVLGSDTHAQHFVIVEEFGETETTIIDPWHGSRKKVATSTLFGAIESLRKRFFYSPLVITTSNLGRGF